MATLLLHYSIASPVKHRQLRVNALLKRELSSSIAREVHFESALVSINHVDVTSDLKNAHVFVSVLASADGASIINKLEAHRPALLGELSRRGVLKYTTPCDFNPADSTQRKSRENE